MATATDGNPKKTEKDRQTELPVYEVEVTGDYKQGRLR